MKSYERGSKHIKCNFDFKLMHDLKEESFYIKALDVWIFIQV